jgi:hypothetical protein
VVRYTAGTKTTREGRLEAGKAFALQCPMFSPPTTSGSRKEELLVPLKREGTTTNFVSVSYLIKR